MGCLYNFGKTLFLFIVICVSIFFLFGAIIFDFVIVANGKEPYFFDPSRVEAYNEPIFENVYEDLIDNYNQYKEAIRSVEREMSFLPDNKRLKVTFGEGSEIDISVSYQGGFKAVSPFDYKAEENQEFMMKIGITADKLDKLKRKVEAANCISIEKEKGLRLGFVNDKDGTFHYRFKSNSSEDVNTLLDSCLIKNLNDHVLVEYTGYGRGPDCIKSDNPEGYDDRSFFRKWYDLLTKDHKDLIKNNPDFNPTIKRKGTTN